MNLNVIKLIDEEKKKLRIETKKAVSMFEKILEYNFESIDLDNWKNNISNLRVGYSFYFNKLGYYEIYNNIIYLKSLKYDYCIYHELFHTASSCLTNNGLISGFFRVEDNNMIGQGINEGYTALLTDRYICDEKSKNSYIIEKYYASRLEKIIGQKQMQSLYLNGNLEGLISILFKYAKEDEIEYFLIGLDNLNDGKLDELTVVHLNRLLLSWFIRKNKIEFEKNKISEDIYKQNVMDFFQNLGSFTQDKVKIKK